MSINLFTVWLILARAEIRSKSVCLKIPSSFKYPNDKKWVVLALPPCRLKLYSWRIPLCNAASAQSSLWRRAAELTTPSAETMALLATPMNGLYPMLPINPSEASAPVDWFFKVFQAVSTYSLWSFMISYSGTPRVFTPQRASRVTLDLSTIPFLVVIITTPFAAREP